MSEDKKVHPLRRKHRRGKRGGKKHKMALAIATPLPDPTPLAVASLRSRLSQLAKVQRHG